MNGGRRTILDRQTSADTPNTNLELTFTSDTTFSIRCGKCADIHNAQLEGKTDKPCSCDCHDKPNTTYIPYNPCVPCCPEIPYQPIYYTGDPPFERQPRTGDPPFRFGTYTGAVDPTVGSGYNGQWRCDFH